MRNIFASALLLLAACAPKPTPSLPKLSWEQPEGVEQGKLISYSLFVDKKYVGPLQATCAQEDDAVRCQAPVPPSTPLGAHTASIKATNPMGESMSPEYNVTFVPQPKQP